MDISAVRRDKINQLTSLGALSLYHSKKCKKYSPLAKWMHGRLHNCGCLRLPQLLRSVSLATGGTAAAAGAAAAISTTGATTGAASSGAGAGRGWKLVNARCSNWTV